MSKTYIISERQLKSYINYIVENSEDLGPKPTTFDIDKLTLSNNKFRTTVWTGNNLQLTLMCIPVNGEIGLEKHDNIDQFLRIEDGEGKVMMGNIKNKLDFTKKVKSNFAIIIPAGKWHNIINTGRKPLKLYSIYSDKQHPRGTEHDTFEDAQKNEED